MVVFLFTKKAWYGKYEKVGWWLVSDVVITKFTTKYNVCTSNENIISLPCTQRHPIDHKHSSFNKKC